MDIQSEAEDIEEAEKDDESNSQDPTHISLGPLLTSSQSSTIPSLSRQFDPSAPTSPYIRRKGLSLR